MNLIAALLQKLLLLPLNLLRLAVRFPGRLVGRLVRPGVKRVDSSTRLSVLINSLSSVMATQRGLLLMAGTVILVLSLIAHGAVVVLLVSSEGFDRNLYWLCIPFTLLHTGVLAGFTGAMLATPLGQGYKDK